MHGGIPGQPQMNGGDIIKQMVGNAVLITGVIANAWFVETKGEYLIPEEDYLDLVNAFQTRLAKRLMPAKTIQDLREEAQKYVAETFAKAKEAQDAITNDTGASGENTEAGASGEDAP